MPVSGCGKRVDDADEASESYVVPGSIPGRLFGRIRSAEPKALASSSADEQRAARKPKTLASSSADEQRAARKTSGAFKWSDPLLPLLRPHLANHADLSEMTLIISVYDYDALGFDVPMGTTLIPLGGPHLDASRHALTPDTLHFQTPQSWAYSPWRPLAQLDGPFATILL